MKTDAHTIIYRLQYVYHHNESLLDKFRQKGKDVSEQEEKQAVYVQAHNLLSHYDTEFNRLSKICHKLRSENGKLKREIEELTEECENYESKLTL